MADALKEQQGQAAQAEIQRRWSEIQALLAESRSGYVDPGSVNDPGGGAYTGDATQGPSNITWAARQLGIPIPEGYEAFADGRVYKPDPNRFGAFIPLAVVGGMGLLAQGPLTPLLTGGAGAGGGTGASTAASSAAAGGATVPQLPSSLAAAAAGKGTAAGVGAVSKAAGVGSILKRIGGVADKVAPILGNAAQNRANNQTLNDESARRNRQLALDEQTFALTAPRKRMGTAAQADLFNVGPVTATTARPGQAPTYSGGFNDPSLVSDESKRLAVAARAQALLAQLKGDTVEPMPDPARSGVGDRLLGNASLVSSIIAGLRTL